MTDEQIAYIALKYGLYMVRETRHITKANMNSGIQPAIDGNLIPPPAAQDDGGE